MDAEEYLRHMAHRYRTDMADAWGWRSIADCLERAADKVARIDNYHNLR